MARVGDPNVQPQPPQEAQPPAAPAPPFAPEAYGDNEIEVSEDQLRAYAQAQEFDYDEMNDAEREFLGMLYANRFPSQVQPSDPNAPPEVNPLIPTDDDEPTRTAAPPGLTPGEPDGATSGDAAVGQAGGASDGAPQPGAPEAPAAGAGEGGTAVPEGGEPIVTVPGIGDVPLSQLVNELSLARGIQPDEIDLINRIRRGEALAPGQQPAPQSPPPPGWPAQPPQPQPTYPPTPQGYSPQPPAPAQQYQPPPPDQWDDPQVAAQAYGALQAQLQQQAAVTQQLAEQQQSLAYGQMHAQQEAMARAMEPAVNQFAEQHGLSEDEMGGLLSTLQTTGLPQAFAQTHPGDPAGATRAALDALYWSIPQYRERELQGQIAANAEATKSAEQKKAEAGAIMSPVGNTPRVAPMPTTTQGKTNAMAAAIEAAQNGSAPGA